MSERDDHLDQPLMEEGTGDKTDTEPVAPVANSKALIISFVAMLIVGLGNKIFQVLQVIPLHNYPLFTNMLTTFIYIPASFAYIWPMIAYGTAISKESQQIPKWNFAVMGLLDSIAGIMQVLAVTYINNGSLVVLLSQSAIPISMMISYKVLGTRYKKSQYIGALIVALGLITVLVPQFIHPSSTGSNLPLWCAIMILSCIPMCLSSVFKEKALGEVELDAIYLNGWIAVFQFIAAIPLLLPSAPASNVAIKDLPSNLWNGARCFVGINTITAAEAHGDVKVDDCAMAPVYCSIYMAFNLGYNVLIILILKYGSANILWLAMTIMVPLGNVAFALKFMPNSKPLRVTDIIGLVVIMGGLIVYRFWGRISKLFKNRHVVSIEQQAFLPTAPDSPATPQVGVSTPNLGVHTGRKSSRVQQSSRARAVVTGQRSSDDFGIQEGNSYQVTTSDRVNEYE